MQPELRGFARIADHKSAQRQDTEEGYWFGAGVQSGMVSARDLRMIGVSTDNPEWTDLTCFGPGAALRSVYQQFTIGRDCNIGIVELDLLHPPTQPLSPVHRFAQVSLYEDDGAAGTPGTLLGRCIPLPLSALTYPNTQRYLLPLWVPAAVLKNDVIWVGVSELTYLGPGEAPPFGPREWMDCFLNSRGNRDPGALDFIKSEQSEPPLIIYTLHDDRRIFVRLYEPPESVLMSVPPHVGAPRASSGFRAIIARPQEGSIASAYALGIRPGHGTQPWSAGGYYVIGSGIGNTVQHNALSGIQGGLLDERYHFTELHHDQLAATIGAAGFDAFRTHLYGTGATLSDLSAGAVIYAGAAGLLAGDAAFFCVDRAGGRKGVLIYGAAMGAVPTTLLPDIYTVFHGMNQGSTVGTLTTFSNTDDSSGMWHSRRAKGTEAIPAAVTADSVLYEARASGYNGATMYAAALLRAVATETFSGAQSGTKWLFFARRGGSNTLDVLLELGNQQARLGQAGSAAAPALATVADHDTGSLWPAANCYGFGTNGVLRAYFNASGHFLPELTGTYDVGENATPLRWRYLWSTEVASGNCNSFEALIAPGQNITVGSDKLGASFIAPWAMTIVRCSAYAQVAPTGAAILFDVHKNGTTIWAVQAQRLTIAAGANAGNTSTFGTTALAQGDRLTFDVDQVGSTIAGANVTLEITFRKTALI